MRRLQLQPLNSDLLPAAVELDRRALGGMWTLDGYQRELDSPNSDLLVLFSDPTTDPVANLAPDAPPSKILGLACLWAILEEAHITTLAIDPAYSRQGLGQALLYALLAAAHHRGLEWATLEVRVSNEAAIALYQKFGFESVGERKAYYPNNENALILWRKGLQKPEFQRTLQDWWTEVGDRLGRSGWHLGPPDAMFSIPPHPNGNSPQP
ncbi:MAG: ribosomal protein S18-alanine N-acetyltransferase [Oculatellaceae cyanobacterium Prado106]|jgi:ribosomal-protein-alanine N-acetyltransferase|nr:ribosomal protein S18-alanine N-acetyltransferase [Oculatellaceae cyanobacterium Prado106]